VMNGLKSTSSEEWVEMFEENKRELREIVSLAHEKEDTWSFELFNQIADRFRTLWSIISAMQIRDSLHRRSHCASLFSSLLAIINE